MLHKTFVQTAVALSFALTAGVALASGSDGGGQAEMGDTAAYNTGKSVFATKLACSGCPMAGKSLDANAARALLANKGNVTLTPQESAALDVYLKRRFKL
jgi:2-methylcitrate dehydratase PrpD